MEEETMRRSNFSLRLAPATNHAGAQQMRPETGRQPPSRGVLY